MNKRRRDQNARSRDPVKKASGEEKPVVIRARLDLGLLGSEPAWIRACVDQIHVEQEDPGDPKGRAEAGAAMTTAALSRQGSAWTGALASVTRVFDQAADRLGLLHRLAMGIGGREPVAGVFLDQKVNQGEAAGFVIGLSQQPAVTIDIKAGVNRTHLTPPIRKRVNVTFPTEARKRGLRLGC
ncbi:hypothetical protein [Rhodopseudomonas pseudopalustris]|uniref:hypothetical protein n=1 Tax=Rhodopseudomonas pseudopalustris TaxID=1513892 RepID=UPI003F9A1E9B